ncbi:hypothetical protein XENOCAPTIV_018889 [Xenoophorus captivus]|uniref:Uncharacterized protein n=1 Tax=Xenoophorus captivus TaxID=1517983 RepID=A0ABV0SG28_9TELE
MSIRLQDVFLSDMHTVNIFYETGICKIVYWRKKDILFCQGLGVLCFLIFLPAISFAWSIEGTVAPECKWAGVNHLLIADWGYLSLKLSAFHQLSVTLQL